VTRIDATEGHLPAVLAGASTQPKGEQFLLANCPLIEYVRDRLTDMVNGYRVPGHSQDSIELRILKKKLRAILL
jgi:hypothetical protein